MKLRSRFLQALLVTGLSWMVSGCGGGQATPPDSLSSHISVSVSPKSVVNLPAGGTLTFTAIVTGSTNQGVTWSIQEGASCGSISNSGTSGDYSAPNSPGLTCHIVATSQADTSKSDIATVTISPTSIYVLPFQVSLGVGQMQAFAATVQGTTNTSVTWSVKEGVSGGSITNQGTYTAPQTLGTFHVIATSQADSRFTATAEVDVVPIAVSISPAADTLGPMGTRTFAASVTGTNQLAVSWSIQEGADGGSITQQGMYTAPQNQGSFHIVATSIQDPTKEAIATIAIVQSGFLSTGSMSTYRALHTATLLRDNKVLIVGGCEEDYTTGCAPKTSAELFDSTTGTFSLTGSLAVARDSHTATLFPNGKVLIAGGLTGPSTTTTAELYDAATGAFTPTGSMVAIRHSHTATLLSNGKVLVTGGADISGAALASAELYDPASETFAPTGTMLKPRVGHSATLLTNGKVLIVGGDTPACAGCLDVPDNTAELYDPATSLFTRTGDMPWPISGQTATRLNSGAVLVVGGYFCGIYESGGAGSECATSDVSNQAVLYDPAASTFSVTGSMAFGRAGHSATLLPDGKTLIAGGIGEDPRTEAEDVTFTAELYDPATGLFSRTGSMVSARTSHTASLLSNGTVLVVGGCDQIECSLSTAELYK